MTDVDAPTSKKMRLRYAGVCRGCGTRLPAGQPAVYYRDSRTVSCIECQPVAPAELAPTVPEPDPVAEEPPQYEPPDAGEPPHAPTPVAPEELDWVEGVAGASARQEFERRHAARDKRVRERFPRAGGFLLAIYDDPQTTRAWERGAVGEESLGGRLNALAGPSFRVLHDRRIPRSRANIDHIVICPNGVFVIDAKRYKGRPRLVVEGGIFRPRTERLAVGNRDQTKLVDGVLKQIGVVSGLLDEHDVPVSGVLCFVEAEWPLIGGSFQTRGVSVLWPKKLFAGLRQPGPLQEAEIDDIHRALRDRLPAH